jgi:FdhD protein
MTAALDDLDPDEFAPGELADDGLDAGDLAARAPRRTATTRVTVRRVGSRAAGLSDDRDVVVVEEPLRIHVEQGGHRHLLGSTMRTPGHDLELAAGLAVGEGVVTSADQIRSVRPCRDGRGPVANEVTVVVTAEAVIRAEQLGRVSTPSSACGLCGRDAIDAAVAGAPRITREVRVATKVLGALPERMRAEQRVFARTGGLHAAALADRHGTVAVVREDVGRHNAVDKVVGHHLLAGTPADVLVVSGRAGFEIVQKAAMAGIPVVASVSAPTSLAVDAARACGLTLAAFVRDGRMTVYAGAERIT